MDSTQQSRLSPRQRRLQQCFRYGLLILGVILLAAGIYLLWGWALPRHRAAVDMQGWTEVMARVTSAGVRAGRPPVLSHRRGSQKDHEYAHDWYYPEVSYTYEVDGRQFTSSRFAIDAGPRWPKLREAEAYVDRYYKEGGCQFVYYNPQDPAEAVLSLTERDEYVLPVALSISFIVFGGVVVVGFIVKWIASTVRKRG